MHAAGSHSILLLAPDDGDERACGLRGEHIEVRAACPTRAHGQKRAKSGGGEASRPPEGDRQGLGLLLAGGWVLSVLRRKQTKVISSAPEP